MNRNHLGCLARLTRGFIVVVMLVAALSIRAATVWTGPLFSYSQPTPDPIQATNQDRITADVWLTRAASKGLFNAFLETNATAFSPTNTEWALGTLTKYASLHYTNWLAWLNGASPVTLVGQPVVVHLITDDIYLSIQFTFWVAGGSGGFAYQRSTPAPVNLSGAAITNNQFTFSYDADPGFLYVVQSSTNLVDWVSLLTNVPAGSPGSFSNPLNPAGLKFYRVGRWPNP
jgi:hypothetical protein